MNSTGHPRSFALAGTIEKAQLVLDGEIVTVGWLSKNGFSITPSPIKDGEHCLICAPKESGRKSNWVEVSVTCNGVRGLIWLCRNCSKVYVHRNRGKHIWAELLSTLESQYINHSKQSSHMQSSHVSLNIIDTISGDDDIKI